MAHGHITALWHDQATIGPVSVILRAPFAALAQLGSDSSRAQYRWGCFACLLVCGLLILWLAQAAHRRGVHPLLCVALAAGLMVNPLTFRALALGHPEEPLAALLVVVALVAASERRVTAAGIAFGLALATKQWALLAAGPLLLATPTGLRRPVAVAAIATAAVLFAPVAVGDTDRFHAAQNEAASPHANATPTNAWWPLAKTAPDARLAPGSERRRPPAWVRSFAHWIVLALAFGGAALVAVRTREPDLSLVLGVTALIFLLRCVLDPYTFSYHHWPFLAALAAYEVIGKRRFPFLAVISAACLYYLSYHLSLRHEANPLLHFYLGWSLPMTAVLLALTVRQALRPSVSARPC